MTKKRKKDEGLRPCRFTKIQLYHYHKLYSHKTFVLVQVIEVQKFVRAVKYFDMYHENKENGTAESYP